MTAGHLYGVGVGPGDPELMTIKARSTIAGCRVVAHFAARGRTGNARAVIDGVLGPHQRVLRLEYPVTTEAIDTDDYERLLIAFYDATSEQVAAELDAGHDVAVVCEGDPFLYGSYMYVHARLADRYDTTVVPGVTSFSAAAAAAGEPLVSTDEALTILPGVLSPEELKTVLATSDAAVIMKVGRNLGSVREALASLGLTDRALYVERASTPDERVLPLDDTVDVDAPYFSLVIVPGRGLRQRW